MVDLTGVTQSDAPQVYELELEIRDTRVLLHEAEKEAMGKDNMYLEMVQVFLNSIREFESVGQGTEQNADLSVKLFCRNVDQER